MLPFKPGYPNGTKNMGYHGQKMVSLETGHHTKKEVVKKGLADGEEGVYTRTKYCPDSEI